LHYLSAMSVPKTILVPTDFSAPADRALDYALELREKLGARVIVMHVYEITPLDFLDGALVSTGDAAERLKGAAQASLDANIAKHADRGVALTSLLTAGEPRESIHTVAQDVGADLIVIGTHGRRGLSRALLGSVAEHIVRTATLPVLTVHARRAADA